METSFTDRGRRISVTKAFSSGSYREPKTSAVLKELLQASRGGLAEMAQGPRGKTACQLPENLQTAKPCTTL